jgi:GTPase SAR1 family protein
MVHGDDRIGKSSFMNRLFDIKKPKKFVKYKKKIIFLKKKK